HLAHEHALVVGTVRIVTGDAALADRRVLPQIRSALVGVAARTRLVDRRAGLQEPDVLTAVRVVARRAGHGAFTHRHVIEPVLLVGDAAVAGAAQRHLVLDFQLRRPLRVVDAVTAHAADVALVVLTAVPERVRVAVVAGDADLAGLLRLH